MTRLEKAIAQLTKAMGPRPFVVIYDKCHPQNAHCDLGMSHGNGYLNALGLVTWAREKLIRAPEYKPPQEKEGGGS